MRQADKKYGSKISKKYGKTKYSTDIKLGVGIYNFTATK